MLPAVATVSLAIIGWCAKPLLEAPAPVRLEVTAQPVHTADYERILGVLNERAPGWGLDLRSHVAQAIEEESKAAALDPMLVMAVIQVESEFRAGATSIVGARGLMQIRPVTLQWVAQREGVKLSLAELTADPSLNVRLGVRYLKYLKDTFRGRLDLALMAYNAGPNKLNAALKQRQGDQWANYVRAVRREYAVLKQSLGESGDWALASR